MSLGSGLLSDRGIPHFTQSHGAITGDDVALALQTLATFTVEEWSNLAAADDDALKTSIASSDADVVYATTDLNGAVGLSKMTPPRNVTVTSTSHADIDAVAVVVRGKDVNGNVLTETITLTNGGGVTDAGVKCFSSVTSITVPAQSGAGGALQFGFGTKVGFAKRIKARAGLSALTREIVGGRLLESTVTEELVDVATADVNAIKTTIATSNAIQTYITAALNGVIGAGVISPPRNITVTSTSHADVDAVAVVVTGEDIYGNVISDTITLTNGGGATDAGDVPFAKVTSIVVPAQSGAGGAIEVGTGVIVGFASPVKFRNSDPVVLAENEAGTVKAYDVLAGTYVAPGTNGSINGHVTMGSAPDGSKDYAYVYEPLRGAVASALVSAPYGSYTPPVPPGGAMDVAVYYEYDPLA